MKKHWPGIVLTLLAGGCSSVSVIGEQENAALAPTVPPPAVYVRLFEVPAGAEFEVATPNKGEDVRRRVGQLIADGIFTRSSRWIAPGRVAGDDEKLPASGLLIDGRLLRTQQGSRALRLGIGFGLGRSHMDTSVRVFNLAKSADKPWLTFDTTGGSNMEPGLAAALVTAPISAPVVALPAAASMAGGAVSTASRGFKGVTQDGKRTGRAIAAAVHDHLAVRQLVERKAYPKRGGRVPTPLGEVDFPQIRMPWAAKSGAATPTAGQDPGSGR
ncbi:MAG: DUF4410 domain-containing protein [Chthoniobacterales bacterium]